MVRAPITLGLGSAYAALSLDEQWYPWDEGSLGQMAERTLGGQLPHREFADIYTGGLSFFDAGVFWLFGTDLLWLRAAMFPFFLLFVAATYFIALRLMRPWVAALLSLTLVVWTVPNYPAAMPSWYNLFFSVVGLAALVRWLEVRRDRWLVLAGFLGGLSVVVKIVGLYYLAGVVFFLVWRTALSGTARPHARSPGTATLRRATAFGLSAVGLAAALWLIAPQLGSAEFVAFVPAVASAAVALGAVAGRCGTSEEPMLRPVLRFVLGAAVPVIFFAAPYVVSGGLTQVVSQVFGSSQSRLNYAANPPLHATAILQAAPFVALLVIGRLTSGARRVGVVIALCVYVSLLPSHDVSRYFVNPLRELLPVLAPAAAVAITLAVRGRLRDSRTAEILALLLFVAAFNSLVQFPFASMIYFLYILPLVALAAVAFLRLVSPNAAAAGTVVLCAYLLAGLLHLQPGAQGAWRRLTSTTNLTVIDAQRGRILIPASQAATYAAAVGLLRRHAHGGMTVAGPDTPELYYLARLQNPTPMIFDFLTPEPERDRSVLDAARRPDVTAVVVNNSPQFSPPYAASVTKALDGLFPRHQVIGQFDIRWRA